ncbi:hypothetical protein [Actinoplanes aureus]|uniref:Uncharacterized protein n=1 Tax=Actinoplanes aureus TaxID=2792083 RepID=A0A931C7Y1_9ACTN|nr:hypothetical protein [Actinoplanes aureus]MBG0562596.1 hypothetical protein [Actinoplanes aureus]
MAPIDPRRWLATLRQLFKVHGSRAANRLQSGSYIADGAMTMLGAVAHVGQAELAVALISITLRLTVNIINAPHCNTQRFARTIRALHDLGLLAHGASAILLFVGGHHRLSVTLGVCALAFGVLSKLLRRKARK